MKSRLNNYLDLYYLNNVKHSMPITGAILKYGVINFELFILEVVPTDSIIELSFKEAYWYSIIRCSYFIIELCFKEAYWYSIIRCSYNVDLNFMGHKKTQYSSGNAPSAERIKANSAIIGRVVTSETRKKISDALKGRPQSDKLKGISTQSKLVFGLLL